jgi:phosphate starvation-inducible PhoH-like protein
LELTITLPGGDERLGITGAQDRNLKIIRESLGVALIARGSTIRVTGDSLAVGQAAQVLELLANAARKGRPMNKTQVLNAIANAHRAGRSRRVMMGGADLSIDEGGLGDETMDAAHTHGSGSDPTAPRQGRGVRRPDDNPWEHTGPRRRNPGFGENSYTEKDSRHTAKDGLEVFARGRSVAPVTAGQTKYVDAILTHDMTFCIGPAGTGKTYLAVAAAVSLLRRGEVRKLVLARPAVEAGERLGFLPGDLQEKVNPFVRPLLDALHDMMDFEQIQRFISCDLIEIVPLAFMRGRTLNDCMIILDEAQNTTRTQMLMFLTRMGHGSKMVITGDTTQTDLTAPGDSGLVDACARLAHVKGVAFVTLEQGDIVRHSLVQRVVEAYGEQALRGKIV